MKRIALMTTLIATAIGATLALADPGTPGAGVGPCGMGAGGGYGTGAGCGAGPGPGGAGCGTGPGAGYGAGPGAGYGAGPGCGAGAGYGHGPMHGRGMGMGYGPGGGDPLLSDEERAVHMAKMQSLKSVDECNAYVAEFRQQLEARAKERGVAAPSPGPRGDVCERLKARGRLG